MDMQEQFNGILTTFFAKIVENYEFLFEIFWRWGENDKFSSFSPSMSQIMNFCSWNNSLWMAKYKIVCKRYHKNGYFKPILRYSYHFWRVSIWHKFWRSGEIRIFIEEWRWHTPPYETFSTLFLKLYIALNMLPIKMTNIK